jgi:hypothetical protein
VQSTTACLARGRAMRRNLFILMSALLLAGIIIAVLPV